MAHDLAAALARARAALAPPAQKAAPPSLAVRARAALARLRGPSPEPAQKAEAGPITAATLGPGAAPPEVVGAEDIEREKKSTVRDAVGAASDARAAPAQAAAKAENDAGPPSGLPPKLVDFGGIPVLVDRPRGFVQRKLDDTGNLLWERTYLHDYGYLAGTNGGDGEGLDVFLGPNPEAPTAWWIVQTTGHPFDFDEYKLMLGFDNQDAAHSAYLHHVPEKFFGSVSPMPVDRLKALLGLPGNEAHTTSLKSAPDVRPLLDAIGEATGQRQRVELVASTKAATDEQFIFGIVLKPEVKDLQREIYGYKAVRDTAHLWMAEFRNTDLQHKVFINDAADPVESTIEKVAYWMAPDGEAYPADPATGDPIGAPAGAKLRFVPKGSWTVAHHIRDGALWADIKAGKYTGYSINGLKKLARPAAAA